MATAAPLRGLRPVRAGQVVHEKAAKAADFDALPTRHGIAESVENGLHGLFGVTLRQLCEALGQGFDEV